MLNYSQYQTRSVAARDIDVYKQTVIRGALCKIRLIVIVDRVGENQKRCLLRASDISRRLAALSEI